MIKIYTYFRFEQTSVGSSTCKEDLAKKGKCYGGLARMYQAIQERRQNDNQHTLLFNAGDMYQVRMPTREMMALTNTFGLIKYNEEVMYLILH